MGLIELLNARLAGIEAAGLERAARANRKASRAAALQTAS